MVLAGSIRYYSLLETTETIDGEVLFTKTAVEPEVLSKVLYKLKEYLADKPRDAIARAITVLNKQAHTLRERIEKSSYNPDEGRVKKTFLKNLLDRVLRMIVWCTHKLAEFIRPKKIGQSDNVIHKFTKNDLFQPKNIFNWKDTAKKFYTNEYHRSYSPEESDEKLKRNVGE